MFSILLVRILEMFLLMMVGVAVYKTHIVDTAANQKLSGLLLKVINPALILNSYLIPYKQELMHDFAMTFVLSLASMVLAIILSSILIRRRKGNTDTEVERFAVIYSNCGFIGVPLANGLMGATGVFLMTACITAFNMIVWTHGLAMMSGNANFKKAAVECITQPATIAIILGLILFIFQVPVPKIISEPLAMLGDMNTPLAMIVSGVSLAASDFLAALKHGKSYLISLYKLVLIPAVVLGLSVLAGLSGKAAFVNLISTACPAGVMVTMFSLQWDKNYRYSAELVAITTVLSIITMPVILGISASLLGM